ncbi:MAG: tRNA (adenosine(37)-N6)-dimethylallyltransferase MiaA [Candidatus Firestonebacteria bacterium]
MAESKKIVVAIVGPTGVGKTEIAISLAEKLNTEIISADSMQVYKYLDIGTDKPNIEMRNRIKHHLIDFLEPDKRFSAGEFANKSKEIIEHLHLQGKIPILVGGTGLYINAVLDGVFESPKTDYILRHKLEEEAKEFGVKKLYERLKTIDSVSSSKIHINDLKRIIRALEIYELTGIPISELQKHNTVKPGYLALVFGITRNKDELHIRISERVDKMIKNKLVNEVENVIKLYGENAFGLGGLGYKEIFGFLKQEYCLEKAVDLIKQNTKRYIKRQMTWFRNKMKNIEWIILDNNTAIDKVTDKMLQNIKEMMKYEK